MHNTAAELAAHRQQINGILAKLQDRLDKHLSSHSSFDQWLAETGLSGQQYRDDYRQGRIDDSDISAALAYRDALDAGKTLAGTTLEAVYRALLIHGLPSANVGQNPSPEAVQREVTAAYRGNEADTDRQLWQAITEKLALAMPPLPAETPKTAVPQDTTPPDPHTSTRLQAGLEFDLFMAELGGCVSFRDFVHALSGVDVLNNVRPQLLRIINSALDLGVAAWRLTETGQASLFTAWRAMLPFDANLFLHQLPDWQEIVTELPEQAPDCISLQLLRLGIPAHRWETYLQRLLTELPGCSQLIARYAGQAKGRSVSLADYLAIRLVLDRLWLNQACHDLWQVEAKISALTTYFHKNLSEFFVRKRLYQGQLPEHLAALAETLISRAGSERQCRSDWQRLADLLYGWELEGGAQPGLNAVTGPGWRLFRLCRLLGFAAQRIRPLQPADLLALLERADSFDANEQSKIWLYALEHHYRHHLFASLQETKQHPLSRPIAQVVFCMDNREESARRNVEMLEPTIETFGTRGFMNATTASQDFAGEAPKRQNSFIYKTLNMNLAASFITINGFAPIALLELLGKSLWPKTRQRLLEKWPKKDKGASPSADPGLTWDADTQAKLAADFLLEIGLTGEFSDWVVLMGHCPPNGQGGRHTQPLCQACNGRNSDRNAEILAAILNQPQIRSLLKRQGIAIPGPTRFIAAGHDHKGQLRWPTFNRQPEPPALEPLQSWLQQALTRSVEHTGHHADCSNHSGHAALIIGRRQITKGLSLERRAFLLSYDPGRDVNGDRLENILLAELPGLIGMNLDYYSASVEKLHHADNSNLHDNPVGFFTLMSGTDGDYRTGFSRQELEAHEAMRLTIVVETEVVLMAAMLRRNADLNKLFVGSWAYLAVIDPKTKAISTYKPDAGCQFWATQHQD